MRVTVEQCGRETSGEREVKDSARPGTRVGIVDLNEIQDGICSERGSCQSVEIASAGNPVPTKYYV